MALVEECGLEGGSETGDLRILQQSSLGDAWLWVWPSRSLMMLQSLSLLLEGCGRTRKEKQSWAAERK